GAMTRAVAPAGGALIGLGGMQSPTPDIDRGVRDVLAGALQFSAGELADLQRGRAVKHGLEARAPGEFGVAGGIRIAATKTAFLDAARDIASFKAGEQVLQIGRFSSPPAIEDLGALNVGKADFDAASCRVGDCDVSLPAAALRPLPTQRHLHARAAQDQTAAWFTRVLLAD